MKEASILKVSSKSSPSAVAGAIAGLVRENAIIELDALGAGAVNQAVKSIAIARGFVASSGYNLVCIPAFGGTNIDDEERTLIRLIIKVEI